MRARARRAFQLLGLEPPGLVVDHAQGAEGGALGADEGGAGVEAEPCAVGDEGVGREAGVGGEVGDLEDGGRVDDGMGTERLVPRHLDGIDPRGCLHPQAVLVDEVDEGDRGPADGGGELDEVVEVALGKRVEDLVGPQDAEAGLLVGGQGGRDEGQLGSARHAGANRHLSDPR